MIYSLICFCTVLEHVMFSLTIRVDVTEMSFYGRAYRPIARVMRYFLVNAVNLQLSKTHAGRKKLHFIDTEHRKLHPPN